MEIIELKTLVDITKPIKIHRPGQGTELEQNQFKNWITLQQCIGLRSIIEYDLPPIVEKIDIKGLEFGSKFKGEHNVWTFTFRPDRSQAYDDGEGNSIGLLITDLHEVPIIKNLTETINIVKEVFDLENSQTRNTVIKTLYKES